MKKLILSIAFILFSLIISGQTVEKGSYVTLYVFSLNINPESTFEQWEEFALNTWLPAFNKEFKDEITQHYAYGESGAYKDYICSLYVFESLESRNKYYPEGKFSDLFWEKASKVMSIWAECEKMGTITIDHETHWAVQ